MAVPSASQPERPGDSAPRADQRLVLLNVSWERYEIELALRGERPVPRMAYVNGVMVELPSLLEAKRQLRSALRR